MLIILALESNKPNVVEELEADVLAPALHLGKPCPHQGHVAVPAAGVGDNVEMVLGTGHNQVVLDAAVVVGEDGEGAGVGRQAPHVRHRQALNEVEPCLKKL